MILRRRAGPRRCPACRDTVHALDEALACGACGVVLHAECTALLERCASLGCEGAWVRPLHVARARSDRALAATTWAAPPRSYGHLVAAILFVAHLVGVTVYGAVSGKVQLGVVERRVR